MRNFAVILTNHGNLFFMLTLRPLLLTLISFAVLPAAAIHPKASHLLDTLDFYVNNHNSFRKSKCEKIRAKTKSLNLTANSCQQLPLYADIVNEYMHIDADSALHYANLATKLCRVCSDSINMSRFEAMRSYALSGCGDLYLAIMNFERISPNSIPQKYKGDYYEAGYNIYFRALRFQRNDSLASEYMPKIRVILDSLNTSLADTDIRKQYYSNVNAIHSDNSVEAVANMIDMLTYNKPGSFLYGQMALEVARYYVSIGQNDLAKYYYSMAGINNISQGYNETSALHELGILLHDEGDIDRANFYIKTTLDRALIVGDHAAALRIAQSIKTLLDDVSNNASRTKNTCYTLLAIALILFAVSLCFFIIYRKKHSNACKHSTQLTKEHDNKDIYIKKLLALCAMQLSAIEDYNRFVGRKIKASQVSDLLQNVEDRIMLNDNLQAFHVEFDNAYLSMRPNFIAEVNELMLDDKQFVAPTTGLNTELRYLAFMTLGIDDYQQLAIFLGITQNSAYTYKNKIKSRAKNRDKFEEIIVNFV